MHSQVIQTKNKERQDVTKDFKEKRSAVRWNLLRYRAMTMAKDLEPGEVFPGQNKVREILKNVDIHGALMQERHGGEMLEDFEKWLEEQNESRDDIFLEVSAKLDEIKKEYGIGG